MLSIAEQLENLPSLQRVAIPDLWQQQAVAALREGKDVVVQAPTGAGKTLIFELWSKQGRNRGQAIYTVPTRALANDKLAEWRARGWEVGIATGDLSENLCAPVLVATLETQKNRLIQGEGPALLVVDEYQMLGDLERGLNYELALALAPPQDAIAPAFRQRGQSAERGAMAATAGPQGGAGAERFAARAAGGSPREQSELSRAGGDSRLLAAAGGQGAGGGLGANPHFRPAPPDAPRRWRRNWRALLPTPNPLRPERGTKRPGRRGPGPDAQVPRRLSPQRLELRGAGLG